MITGLKISRGTGFAIDKLVRERILPPSHEEPIPGATNYAYVKVKNRGTLEANDVVVKACHSKPQAGLFWPDDFQPISSDERVKPLH